MPIPFIGRTKELEILNKLLQKGVASLIVVRGRRRIGKSRLIEEFAKDKIFLRFAGIPPTTTTTSQTQRDEFARQLSTQTDLPEIKADDWSKLFLLLAEKSKRGRIVILFDEISWIGSKDADFLGKLKNAWDLYFKKNQQLIFIICGSVSKWIEKNIMSSTGFMGRISYKLDLKELPLSDSVKFWGNYGTQVSTYEKFKLLAITGGVPRYLEEIKTALSAEENIRDLCFVSGGVLVDEFEQIFSDLFSRRSAIYKNIVATLANGALEIKDICKKIGLSRTGLVTEYLNDLLQAGFISRDFTWHFSSGEDSRLSHYRLSDNYLRFYLKYIVKNRNKIAKGDFVLKSVTSLPAWEAIMGLQFENLVLNNRWYVKKCLQLSAEEILADNPFFQRKAARNPGCQIDYLIQTKYNNLYACEIKFSKTEIKSTIIREMQQKIVNLKYPRGFSCCPILIHVNGVSPAVEENDYFAKIINFGDILL